MVDQPVASPAPAWRAGERGHELSTERLPYRSVLVTGASGYIGRQLVSALARAPGALETIVAADVRPMADVERTDRVAYEVADVRTADLADLCRRHAVELVVHLAAVVTPPPGATRAELHAIDVGGTERVLAACAATGVRKLIYTSSGAAYGYHADNPAWLDEGDALRGNPEFAYADHKRQVEERLAAWRSAHPELRQLILRPGTILGAGTHNQISALFDGRFVLGLRGAQSPFVLVWDADVVGAILHGIRNGGTGIFNLAGDGTLSLREMAALMGKPYVALPPALVAGALRLLQRCRLTPYGPEQVEFLRYRPVLSNRRIKEEFGYAPRKTTREVFELFLAARRHG